MSLDSWKKTLKIVSVACIVVYAAFAAFGVAIAASLISPDEVMEGMGVTGILQGDDADLFASISGIVIAVTYLIMLLCTVAVLRGVKNPSKMKLGMVLYGILSVLMVLNFIMTLTSGSDLSTAFTQCWVTVLMFGGCIAVYRSAK